MCCGTHVSNLSDIQVIKLLHTETKKGSIILYYIAGNRVVHYLRKTVQIERNLTKLLRYIAILIVTHDRFYLVLDQMNTAMLLIDY